MRYSLFALLCILSLSPTSTAWGANSIDDEEVSRYSRDLVFGDTGQLKNAVNALVSRDNPDVIPAFVSAMRYRRGDHDKLRLGFQMLTGDEVASWHEAMLWQQAHPEIKPHESFRELKLHILELIDERFLRFLGDANSRSENLDIRLEEITWGGVGVDGIPSLDFPAMVSTVDADYLSGGDLVFGIEINGDSRAYPLRIMGWHEMFNDVIGGVPVALAYCTLCGAGILFETKVEGRDEPFILGSSGLLYRSNKLMFDRQTNSLWNQFTGRPVSGPLHGSGVVLKMRPVSITSWDRWRRRHPHTTALSLDTGYRRDYGSGVVYRDYFASPDLMFPAIVRTEEQVQRKGYVFGIRMVGAAKAWPLDAFKVGPVINDHVGSNPIVLIGDAGTRTVRAYYRGNDRFESGDRVDQLKGKDGADWKVEEERLVGPGGKQYGRIPGHISYWFAWDGYLGAKSELYDANSTQANP